ncbi:glycoside hydrolase family 13 protein [Mycolicibacterium austroafricanum]|uniref:Glycoside hydrolase family 13 protein n=2 Tax=Mycolicibacterium TaxID=1866885 RepID=A0ABT8HAU3_MYCAO|nr:MULTISPECIES: glycoside hydrolase family 13 protein [Mycolicibacterium]MDN4517834.1 glycoside hydrolase family 13 protein [Mycolicibacterium austroafricanum]MDW5613710.1 glycoside hydrolase family 13 protein [Mycolicibacterium sp. D5.8-2]QRZ09114.1 glycoside hydrolase family 13 protein [Mycolicibacterium austroafricanum]QZT70888.1 glycoside hydrolase family 13 protein [Mycolicibacterium austroafricanum]UJL27073.1 glycoside hydrolase family 13 protein [Mycolicibacterium vanbaalenii]
MAPEESPWWQTAVVYQVYIRSFADGNGDGVGDIAGLRARLPYLARLGVDAMWINPWYPSPMADAGYDVADYRDIEPAYGTLEDARALIAEAHALGIRVILDIVPNHTSDQHAWFRAALAGEPGARRRYHFLAGRGADGELPPNDWQSVFGGPAWTRVDRGPLEGQWYLHLFAPGQPDLNWENDEVRAEFEDILAFWFDRGVDGFRIDVAHGLVKAAGLPDGAGVDAEPHTLLQVQGRHPAWDQDGVHDIYRGWRAVADRYAPERIFIAEAWVSSNARLARYLRPDELHTAFQFDFLRTPWRAQMLREVIDDAIDSAASVGAPPTWVLSNHDVTRTVTRFSRSQPAHLIETDWERGRWEDERPDHALGRRRARAAALVQLALPGTAYVYQGEELGLEEVEDLPDEARQDPTWVQSGFTDVGRDGCRIPLPWTETSVPYGFAAHPAAVTWLPQPEHWAEHSVEAQERDPGSTLNLYRSALELRPTMWRDTGDVKWLEVASDIAAFERGGAQCWVNTGDAGVPLPAGAAVVLASEPGVDGMLPPDTAVWLR